MRPVAPSGAGGGTLLTPRPLALCSLPPGNVCHLGCYGEAQGGHTHQSPLPGFSWSSFATSSLGIPLCHLPNPVLTGVAGGIRLHSAPRALHHQHCHRGAGGRHHHRPGITRLSPAVPLGRAAGVSGPFFSPLAQAGRPLGLSPDGVGAGPEPLMPHGTGQGERGEGRRGEGRSGAGLAAHGSERGGCSVWLLHAFPLLPPHLPAPRAGSPGGCDHQRGTVWLQRPGPSVAVSSPECPLSSSLGPQAVWCLYPSRMWLVLPISH